MRHGAETPFASCGWSTLHEITPGTPPHELDEAHSYMPDTDHPPCATRTQKPRYGASPVPSAVFYVMITRRSWGPRGVWRFAIEFMAIWGSGELIWEFGRS